MINDITLTDLQCSFSGRDVSLFGPCTPICPDEKEFGSFGQKLLKDNLSQKISLALQHSSRLCSSQESQICDIPRQGGGQQFFFGRGGGCAKGVLLRDELHCYMLKTRCE